jgi:hypothetical protein
MTIKKTCIVIYSDRHPEEIEVLDFNSFEYVKHLNGVDVYYRVRDRAYSVDSYARFLDKYGIEILHVPDEWNKHSVLFTNTIHRCKQYTNIILMDADLKIYKRQDYNSAKFDILPFEKFSEILEDFATANAALHAIAPKKGAHNFTEKYYMNKRLSTGIVCIDTEQVTNPDWTCGHGTYFFENKQLELMLTNCDTILNTEYAFEKRLPPRYVDSYFKQNDARSLERRYPEYVKAMPDGRIFMYLKKLQEKMDEQCV